MSISGTTMSVSTMTVGGKDLKSWMNEKDTTRKISFYFPMYSASLRTLDFQNCSLSYIENDIYDIIILDANNKFVCGKLR